MLVRSSFFVVLLAALSFPAPSEAAPRARRPATSQPEEKPAASVERAEALYQELEYERANEEARALLAGRGLGHDELVRTYRVLALTHAVLDQPVEAREAFIKLLAVDPQFVADDNLGPRVTEPFLEARGYFRAQGASPGMTVQPTVRTDGGSVRVVTQGPPGLVQRITVGHRWGGEGALATQTVQGRQGSVSLPAAPAGMARLDYYVLAQDERDHEVMTYGSAAAPMTVFATAAATQAAPAKSKGRSVFKSPVFWVVTTALLAGGAAAGYYFLGPARVGEPTDAALRPVVWCGGSPCP